MEASAVIAAVRDVQDKTNGRHYTSHKIVDASAAVVKLYKMVQKSSFDRLCSNVDGV